MSSSTTLFQVFFGRPRPLFPGSTKEMHFLAQFDSSIRFVWPNQRSLRLLTSSVILIWFNIPWRSDDLNLSFNDAPHIHLIILMSIRSSCFRSSGFIRQVSLPYNNTLRIQLPYSLPLVERFNPLLHRSGKSSRKDFHADFDLAIIASLPG